MKELQVNCITTTKRSNKHERITHIGYEPGTGNNTPCWQLTSDEVIAQIDAKSAAFYTVHQCTGIRAYLGVIREWGKPPYLKAREGRVWNNHLLAQNRCKTASE